MLFSGGKEQDFTPRFRESAYTPVKKVVDTDARDFEEMKEGVLQASEAAIRKKERVLEKIDKENNYGVLVFQFQENFFTPFLR